MFDDEMTCEEIIQISEAEQEVEDGECAEPHDVFL